MSRDVDKFMCVCGCGWVCLCVRVLWFSPEITQNCAGKNRLTKLLSVHVSLAA